MSLAPVIERMRRPLTADGVGLSPTELMDDMLVAHRHLPATREKNKYALTPPDSYAAIFCETMNGSVDASVRCAAVERFAHDAHNLARDYFFDKKVPWRHLGIREGGAADIFSPFHLAYGAYVSLCEPFDVWRMAKKHQIPLLVGSSAPWAVVARQDVAQKLANVRAKIKIGIENGGVKLQQALTAFTVRWTAMQSSRPWQETPLIHERIMRYVDIPEFHAVFEALGWNDDDIWAFEWAANLYLFNQVQEGENAFFDCRFHTQTRFGSEESIEYIAECVRTHPVVLFAQRYDKLLSEGKIG